MSSQLNAEQKTELRQIVAKILVPGKGVLATDDTAGKLLVADLLISEGLGPRLVALGQPDSEESRRKYRQLLYSTQNFGEHLSAVILIDETYRQKTDEGKRFVDILKAHGCVVGVQADWGPMPLVGGGLSGETRVRGLDYLNERLAEYKAGGCGFGKWRAPLYIGGGKPSREAVEVNAKELAEYAATCQRNGLVPFVEPDVVCLGSHSLSDCQRATERVLAHTFAALREADVYLEGIIMKPNMVTAGTEWKGTKPTAEEVAEATLDAFRNTIPVTVPGGVFLSGGQTELDATKNLNAIAKSKTPTPWKLTFCYGRAIQGPVMKVWNGKAENVAAAQKALRHRAKANGLAQQGKYESEEQIAALLKDVKI